MPYSVGPKVVKYVPPFPEVGGGNGKGGMILLVLVL